MRNRTLEVVVGAQFGSEAKGHVVQRLCERAQKTQHVQVVRVAGPNAGHTGYDETGKRWALRHVPVAAVTPGPAVLGIAAGSEIDLDVLLEEFDSLTDAGLMDNKMLWVHGEATMIYNSHKATELGAATIGSDGLHMPTDANLVEKIGSTGKGIGAARADRIMRRGARVADDINAKTQLGRRGISVARSDVAVLDVMDSGGHLIIEGTQGYGLGLRAGFYPKCTSSDCRAIDFMAMAGVHPWQFVETKVWAVARMYPIRVAGNSGPLKNETTWEALGLPEENTTVTQKVRRVGMPDWELVRDAVVANGGAPTVRLAITMVDQMFPVMKDRGWYDVWTNEGNHMVEVAEVERYLKGVQGQVGAPIGMITTGPDKATFMDSRVH